MRTLRFLLQKEFLQIFRDRQILPMIFLMPILQLIVLASAATFEVKSAKVDLLDQDHSPTSRRLVEHFAATGYFRITGRPASLAEAERDLELSRARMILNIPPHFEEDLRRNRRARLLLAYDAVDGATAGILSSYSAVILGRFEREEQAELAVERRSAAPLVRTSPSFWYNRELSYRAFMVPGILVELVTMVGLLLCALNIVREREIGTIEQLNVTPLKRWQFIVGKLVPFWLLGLAALALGLLVAKLVFAIPIRGSVPLVFAIAAVYLLAMNGLGLAVSALSYTQQQATFLALFVLLASILLSGLFTPIDSMPLWAQKLTLANPMAHFVEINRRILLKGSGFGEIQDHFWYLPAAAGIILPLAVLRYRKVGS